MNPCMSDLALELEWERRWKEYGKALLRRVQDNSSSERPRTENVSGEVLPQKVLEKSSARKRCTNPSKNSLERNRTTN